MSKEKQIEEMAYEMTQYKFKVCERIERNDCLLRFHAHAFVDCNCCKLAEHLYEKGYRKQSEWISVEERLPHWSDGKVLVFTQYGFSICERTVNGRWKGQHANWITHWMPLPEAPKGGAE